MVDTARDLAAALRNHSIGRSEYAEFEGEDHAGALTAGTARAIGFALRPPEAPD